MSEEVRVTARWTQGRAFEASGQESPPILVDGEHRVGPGAMELLLAALASCSGYDVLDGLEERKQPATRLIIELRGERAEEPPRRFTAVDVHYRIAGRTVTPEGAAQAIRESMERHCSVAATLRTPITTSFTIEPEE